MDCAVCDKKNLTSATCIPEWGVACSPKCYKKLKAQRKKHIDELLAEDFEVIPSELDLPAFERFVLKFSLHFLRDLPTKEKARLQRNCPTILIPEEMALEIKERVLRYIPLFYVSSVNSEGHERMFCGGRYQFKCKVPCGIVIEAFQKAELVEKRA